MTWFWTASGGAEWIGPGPAGANLANNRSTSDSTGLASSGEGSLVSLSEHDAWESDASELVTFREDVLRGTALNRFGGGG